MGIAFPKRPQTFVVFTPLANGHFSVLNGFDHGGNTSDCADVMDGGTLMMAAQQKKKTQTAIPSLLDAPDYGTHWVFAGHKTFLGRR